MFISVRVGMQCNHRSLFLNDTCCVSPSAPLSSLPQSDLHSGLPYIPVKLVCGQPPLAGTYVARGQVLHLS